MDYIHMNSKASMQDGDEMGMMDDRLTPEEIMAIPACAGMDWETARELADTLAVFTQIVYNVVARENAAKQDQCKVISLCPDEEANETAIAA